MGIIAKNDQCIVDEESGLTITNQNGTITIDAEKAEIGDNANLTITNKDAGEKGVTIPIRVTRNKKKIPCFKNKSQNAEIGSFDEVKLNNASKMGMSFKSSNSDIVDVEYAYLGDANYRLVPKNEGEATITATFKNSEGTVYTDTMTVKVSESKDIVPLKSIDTYEELCQANKLNEDFRITQEEAKKAEEKARLEAEKKVNEEIAKKVAEKKAAEAAAKAEAEAANAPAEEAPAAETTEAPAEA